MSSPLRSESSEIALEETGRIAESSALYIPFTKAERIEQLNEIDKSIAQLLRSAGLAVKTLTTIQASSETPTNNQEAFATAADTYLEELHALDIRLKRQIHGLVEAGIITQEAQLGLGKTEQVQNLQTGEAATSNATKAFIDRGWDVGWLNTRSGKVGADMEAELWSKTKRFLEALKKGDGDTSHDRGDTKMED